MHRELQAHCRKQGLLVLNLLLKNKSLDAPHSPCPLRTKTITIVTVTTKSRVYLLHVNFLEVLDA